MTSTIKSGDLIKLGEYVTIFNNVLKKVSTPDNMSVYATYIDEHRIENSLAICLKVIESDNHILYHSLVLELSLEVFLKRSKVWIGKNVYFFTKVSK